MQRKLSLAVACAIGVASAIATLRVPLQAQSADVQKVLRDIKARDKGQLAVSEEDGRFLRVLVATSKAKRALEIGGASGYSAIWIGMGLRETGGQLVTMEYDPVRARELAENVKRAGLSDIVTVVAGDAFKHLPSTPGSFDFVFLDAWKKDYKRFLDLDDAAPEQGRPLRRAQRGQQAQRDGGLPRRDLEESGAVDDDRVAVGRGDVGVGEAIAPGPPHAAERVRTVRRRWSSSSCASCEACRCEGPPAPVRRWARGATCW